MTSSQEQIRPHHFAKPLLSWYDANKREMPWRDCGDPYRIWVSEIMLQQTRVDQATPYYLRFLGHFPTLEALATANRHEVLMAWEGLGYYSRARNLHDAAKTVLSKHGGVFPQTYHEIRALKGIGPYTAAAVASIAFGLPHAVMDGNVIRVLSRYFGIQEDVSLPATKAQIQQLADGLLDTARPGDFNQAVMELGATVCTPKSPLCAGCPLSTGCVAYKTGKTAELPFKAPKKKIPHHQIVVGICVDDEDRILIALRPEDKMLGGLWEFPGGKVEEGESRKEALIRELKEELGVEVMPGLRLCEVKHAYTHFKITLNAWICRIKTGEPGPRPKASKELRWITRAELTEYPFPKANRKVTEALQTWLENRRKA
ncbi:MAG: A/G-specific adenine glycosylase [Candidatus Cyclonatronum sp.]|uniref:A/G-specific adenine glycosylase n=1 Tax=Cyclonatronum sp. TaxID=3024185 RepID=UPI0025C48556|nr:A/G-specific adenine glycosylase [Cyclonatronum sp.]MCH8486071.1 A/G-specific adenine glycosylase [Cyclonatronum sp.]